MSFLEISPEMFFALLPLPCLRGLKSVMSVTTADLHRLPAVTNLLQVGKWFYRIFLKSSSPISLQVTLPCFITHPQAKKLQRLAFTCAGGRTHQQDIKWGRDCYTLASFQLGSIITGFPRGLKRVKHPPSTASPPSCKSAPRPPPLT